MAHHRQSIILFVECDSLESLVHFNLCEAQVAVEVSAYYFHESESRLLVLAISVLVGVSLAKSVLLQLDALLDRCLDLKEVDG